MTERLVYKVDWFRVNSWKKKDPVVKWTFLQACKNDKIEVFILV